MKSERTRLAYAASEPGLRLGLSSSKVQDGPAGPKHPTDAADSGKLNEILHFLQVNSLKDRAATLLKQLETGDVLVKVDNGEARFSSCMFFVCLHASFLF